MKIFRWILAMPLSILLIVTIVIGLLLVSVSQSLINRDTLKSWLKDSGLYENIVAIAVDELESKINKESTENINIPSKDLDAFSQKVFPPEWTQSNSEMIIDEVYDWAEGIKSRPDFQISLQDRKTLIEDATGELIRSRVSALPQCDIDSNITPENFSPFESTCVPSGIDINEDISPITDEMFQGQGQDLLNKPIFDSQSIAISAETTIKVQTGFKVLKNFPVLLITFVFAISGLIFIITPGIKNKFTHVGSICFVSGIIVVIVSLISRAFISTMEPRILTTAGLREKSEIIQKIAMSLIEAVYSSVLNRYLIYGIITIVIGAILLASSYVWSSSNITSKD